MKTVIVMNKIDTTGNALDDIVAGETVRWTLEGTEHTAVAVDAIPFGFKMALRQVRAGEEIIKYGQVIGCASRPIRAGELVHVHNVCGSRGRGDLEKGSH